MTDREQYTPGPACGAQIRKDWGQNNEDKWTLILVRELRHSPALSHRCLRNRLSKPIRKKMEDSAIPY